MSLPVGVGLHIGIGHDVHAFAAPNDNRPLVIGGVHIRNFRGLSGHSDADVLVHAIIDALLGAARMDDIGSHFPDDDPAYCGANSLLLLKNVAEMLAGEGFYILDIDSVVVAEQPKLAGYREAMRQTLAAAMGISTRMIGVKATTSEGLGFTGRGEGISATAVALLEGKRQD